MASRKPDLHLAQDTGADALLSKDPLALLTGMLLDQQVAMEWAFGAPKLLADRLGVKRLDAAEIAAHDPEEFVTLACTPPAIHRYPAAMAKRIQKMCAHIVEEYDGDAAKVWADAADGRDLLKRLGGLPGYGKQKSQIFVALLGKQLGVQPTGWREAAGSYGDDGARRSIADVVDETTLVEVREFKREQKRAAKAAKAETTQRS